MRRAAWKLSLVICVAVTVMTPTGAFAQATATINGRIVDQADAVLPGVTITATNVNTGIARVTVTNDEGAYSVPALEPGLYTISASVSGFATLTRQNVSLPVTATITIDLKLGLANVTENVTVAGASPLIEVSQSKVSATIRTQEVASLPMLTRRLTTLVSLLPGAKEVGQLHPIKAAMGSMSIGGSTGRNIVPVVDGGDNRDNLVGGPMMSFTMEGLEEFRVASHEISAADGRTSGASIQILTKSGTNLNRGSAFFYGRDKALTAKDYFTKRNNIPKAPYQREQFGGSFGGPMVKNRAFFFGAAEFIKERKSLAVQDANFQQMQLLVPFGVEPTRQIPQPFNDKMATFKSHVQLTSTQSLMGRIAGQTSTTYNGTKTQRNDVSSTQLSHAAFWDGVVQHSWVGGSRALNQFTFHRNYVNGVFDYTGLNGNGQDKSNFFFGNYPNVGRLPATRNLAFPSVTVGNLDTEYDYAQTMYQARDDLTLQLGSHSLKIGGDFSWMPVFGGDCCLYWGQFTFFDDPSVILSNSNGRYPQGFQTPGIVRVWSEGADIRTNIYRLEGTKQVKGYVQDDWRVGSRLTLNLGVRYDRDLNFYGQKVAEQNLTYQALKAIGSPYAGLPKTPTKDFSPRVGFAYNMSGDGSRVLKGGYGLYFDGTGINTHYNIFIQNNRPITFNATKVNTSIGVGQLATYRLGIDPLPAAPTITDRFPPGASSGGYWFDPNIMDPHNQQFHIGYSQAIGLQGVLSADFTHIQGRNDFRALEINPFVNGQRVLAPALGAAFGDPNLIGPLQLQCSCNSNRYDELSILFERRMTHATFRATYVLSGAYAYGGQIAGSAYFVPQPMIYDQPFAPGEWGPTPADERHRIVLYGVFELPRGIQLSPIVRAATARPYNLTAGRDLNADGTNNDRYVDPATGQQVSVNAGRGNALALLDVRATKFFRLGGQERRRIGVFAEMFNLFNRANFGENFQGNALSPLFQQPIGFLAAGQGTYPLTLQLGARFEF
jgi:hypothetical protein